MKQVAVRNLRLCTKDCLCLYVCPTGATDTENSIIDGKKCLGCGVCADACASGAISLVSALSTPQADLTWNLILLAASLGALIVGLVSEWTYPLWSHRSQ